MELKYERVMAPFLLLHVNRWGGGHRAGSGRVLRWRLLVLGARGSGMQHPACNVKPRASAGLLAGVAHPYATAAREPMAPDSALHLHASPWGSLMGRYAGRDPEGPRLLVKGIKAVWRQSAPAIARTLQVRGLVSKGGEPGEGAAEGGAAC